MDQRIDEDTLQAAIEAQFSCARCGHCCKGDGLVHIGSSELDRIARAMGMARRPFLKKYAIEAGVGEYWLRDKRVEAPGSGQSERWCVFLQFGADGIYGCQLGEARPKQCRDFPAIWRNTDSLTTCLGLRLLRADLRRRESIEEPVGAPNDPAP